MTSEQAFLLINRMPVSPGPIPQNWADLGCGSGTFTEALARMLPARSIVYGVDKGAGLHPHTTANGVSILSRQVDFLSEELGLYHLDGILMANSLHYVKDKPAFLLGLKASLKPGASFLIVEYDTDRAVPTWVPYPISFASLQGLFHAAGYGGVQKLASQPSVYHSGDLYAAFISTAPNLSESPARK